MRGPRGETRLARLQEETRKVCHHVFVFRAVVSRKLEYMGLGLTYAGACLFR